MLLTLFNSRLDPVGRRVNTTWEQVRQVCERPITDGFVKDSLPGWSFAAFKGNRRGLDNVESVSALALDYDSGTRIIEALRLWACGHGVLHTSYSHTPAHHKFRVILALSRPATVNEYDSVWELVNAIAAAGGHKLDSQARDASRFFYRPATRPGLDYLTAPLHGNPIDVDRAVALYTKDVAERATIDLETLSVGCIRTRALQWLGRVPAAIAGEHGDYQTHKVAVGLIRGFGLWEEDALELLREYNKRCQPSWTERELKYKIRRAVRSARYPWGFKLGARHDDNSRD